METRRGGGARLDPAALPMSHHHHDIGLRVSYFCSPRPTPTSVIMQPTGAAAIGLRVSYFCSRPTPTSVIMQPTGAVAPIAQN